MKVPAVLFSGLLAIAGVKAQSQGEPIVQLFAVGPPGSGINGPLYYTDRGVEVRSSSAPQHNDGQLVLIRPERRNPTEPDTMGEPALLHLWTEHGDPHPNQGTTSILALEGHRALRPLTFQIMRVEDVREYGGGYDWWSFTLSDVPPVHDAHFAHGPWPQTTADKALKYYGGGRWVALVQSETSHVLAWYDGWTKINGNFYNVDIVYNLWEGPGHGPE